MSDIVKPMVHSNGTSRADLQRQYRDAAEAVRAALTALQQVETHGRDYYPLGADAGSRARDEHRARLSALGKVHTELMELWQAVTP